MTEAVGRRKVLHACPYRRVKLHVMSGKVLQCLGVLLLIAAGFGAGFGIATHIAGSLTIEAIAPMAPNSSPDEKARDLQRRYELLRINLDAAAEEAKRIDRLMTLMLALTSLYGIALGLSSYFGLKQILDSAREDSKTLIDKAEKATSKAMETIRADSDRLLDRAKAKFDDSKADVTRQLENARRDFQDFREEIRGKYPQFADLHANVRDLIVAMDAVFRVGEDWTEQAYLALDVRKRAEILVSEAGLAGLEVFRLESFEGYRTLMQRVWQGLGRFYTAKFRADRTRIDWEKAHLYFERALRCGRGSAGLWKDYGVHLCQLGVAGVEGGVATEKEAQRLDVEAERAFTESLAIRPDEPGSLFGLAWIYFRRSDYALAAAQYSKVGKLSSWQEGERRKYLADALKNAANCRILNNENAETVFADLKHSKATAMEEGTLGQWVREVNGDEDLQAFFATHREEAEELMG